MKKRDLQLPFVETVLENLNTREPLIQVVVGPRQVGKTTGVLQLLKDFPKTYHYCSADALVEKSQRWLFDQWQIAQQKGKETLLVIDEIQKIDSWSEELKKLWDQQKIENSQQLKVIALGSSSLNIQKGLTESLAGRFQLTKVWHWNQQESTQAYSLTFNEYLKFGGYPGSYTFLRHKEKWLDYIRNSIIDAVIGKDILAYTHVKSPALFRQCFDIVCAYPAQEISYNKLLGQLQDKGNVELVKNYLTLFEQAFLIKQLFKFSNKTVLSRTSSPKILPLCPALFSVTKDADLSSQDNGRVFELIVGSLLARKPGKLSYFREGKNEVDFIYQFGQTLHAIEAKFDQDSPSGLKYFKEKHPKAMTYLVTPENYQKVLQGL